MTRDDPTSLRSLAGQCRRLAKGVSTGDVRDSLTEMAVEYERQARSAEIREDASKPPRPSAGER
ncbi:MAG TPA: hypothetical protein VGD66_05315 [Allosphingosinicella sp.]